MNRTRLEWVAAAPSPRTVYTNYHGSLKEYYDFSDELSKVDIEGKKMVDNLKGLSLEDVRQIIWETDFSIVDDDLIQYKDWNLSVQFKFKGEKEDDNLPFGIWHYLEWQWNFYVYPNPKWSHYENWVWSHYINWVFSPEESFPWEWSKDNLNSYLSFSKKLLSDLEKVNKKMEAESRGGKLSNLIKNLFN